MLAGDTHPFSCMNSQRETIRQQMRQRRRSLSTEQIQTASYDLASRLAHSRQFQTSQHIAFYLANDSEIDPGYLLTMAWDHGKTCYLPVLGLRNTRRLWFLPFERNTPLLNNRFGIPEPVHSRRARLLKPVRLDLVFMPLVAFDLQGNRLGMGGGFYDRTLAFLRTRQYWQKPRLIGLAYDFQQIDKLPHASWDVPLHAIATNSGLYPVQHTL